MALPAQPSEPGPTSVWVLPPRPPCRSQSGRLMAPACEVCLRKWPLILSGSLLVFSTDRLGLNRAPNCTVKTHRAVWCITVDAHGPRESPPISLHCGLEMLMKIWGHFGAPSLTELLIAMPWTFCKLSNVSDEKVCFNSIFCQNGGDIMQGRYQFSSQAVGRKEYPWKVFFPMIHFYYLHTEHQKNALSKAVWLHLGFVCGFQEFAEWFEQHCCSCIPACFWTIDGEFHNPVGQHSLPQCFFEV